MLIINEVIVKVASVIIIVIIMVIIIKIKITKIIINIIIPRIKNIEYLVYYFVTLSIGRGDRLHGLGY